MKVRVYSGREIIDPTPSWAERVLTVSEKKSMGRNFTIYSYNHRSFLL